MTWCNACHNDTCFFPDDERHQGMIALAEVIERDRKQHVSWGGIDPECADQMVIALESLGFEIRRKA